MKKITQEDVDKAWEAWNKTRDKAWDKTRKAWLNAWKLEGKFKAQEEK